MPGGRGVVLKRGSMVGSKKSSKESQNTSLSKGNEPCCAFLSRKSNQRLSAECARRVKERSESESPKFDAAYKAVGPGLGLVGNYALPPNPPALFNECSWWIAGSSVDRRQVPTQYRPARRGDPTARGRHQSGGDLAGQMPDGLNVRPSFCCYFHRAGK
jgi:hypothetical protein